MSLLWGRPAARGGVESRALSFGDVFATGGDVRALVVCAGLALACLLVAGLLRRPWGYALGSALQVGVVATGFLVPAMFFLGAVFAVLWVVALRAGARIEHELAAAPGPATG